MNNIENQFPTTELEALRREIRRTKLSSMIACVLMVCVLLGGAWMCHAAKAYAEQLSPVVEKAAAVDWEGLSEQLSALDVEAINEAIDGLDVEELNRTISNVNAAVDALQKYGDSLKSFTSIFGF